MSSHNVATLTHPYPHVHRKEIFRLINIILYLLIFHHISRQHAQEGQEENNGTQRESRTKGISPS